MLKETDEDEAYILAIGKRRPRESLCMSVAPALRGWDLSVSTSPVLGMETARLGRARTLASSPGSASGNRREAEPWRGGWALMIPVLYAPSSLSALVLIAGSSFFPGGDKANVCGLGLWPT